MNKRPVFGIVLAAGLSRRMGKTNKLTKTWRGLPLVSHVVDAAKESALDRVCVVTGHEAADVRAVLPDDILTVHNSDFADGMAGSIGVGCSTFADKAAIMVLLGDMPLVDTDAINPLVARYRAEDTDDVIIAAAHCGKQGNPVLFGRSYSEALKQLKGDVGGRAIINANRHKLTLVEIGHAASMDFDVPEAFES